MARAKKITLDKDVAKNVQDKLAKLKASASEKFTKSQQEILRKMRESNEEETKVKLTDSLKSAFNTKDEFGNTVIDKVAAKAAATYEAKEQVTMNEVLQLQNALGETKQSVDVNVNGFEAILSKIEDKERF